MLVSDSGAMTDPPISCPRDVLSMRRIVKHRPNWRGGNSHTLRKNLFCNCCEIRRGVTIVTTERARLASRYSLPRCRWRNDPPGHRFLGGGSSSLTGPLLPSFRFLLFSTTLGDPLLWHDKEEADADVISRLLLDNPVPILSSRLGVPVASQCCWRCAAPRPS